MVGASGCFTVRYLGQAAAGELTMLRGARPISEVLRDPSSPARVRALLARVDQVKAWGQARGLRPTRSYEAYSDVKRSAAVYVVQACAPLAFDVKRWRFPLVGSVPYLGFFSEAEARAYAETLAAAEGLDVDVREARAFSTLGHLRDPVLSTMLSEGDSALGDFVNVILHESVHATVYVRGQSAFDESLASFVADHLTLAFLEERKGPGAKETAAWVASQRTRTTTVARLRAAYGELDALYRSSAPDSQKRAEKERLLEAVRVELGRRRALNNATLSGYRTYSSGVEAFERLLAACEGSWPRFLATLGHLDEADFPTAQAESFGAAVPTRCAPSEDVASHPPPAWRAPER